MKTMAQQQLFHSHRNDWETPQGLFDELDAEFHFTLDPCATHENAKVARHFTREENGLAQSWEGHTVFMNPPYGAVIASWVKKAHDEVHKRWGGWSGNRPLVVGLLPARTDTAWWHDYIEGKAEVRFLRGRIRFSNSRANAPFPSAVVIWR